MKVELIEKGDSTIIAKFTAQTPQESLIFSLAVLGLREGNVGCSTETSGYKEGGTVTFQGFSVKCLDMMGKKDGDPGGK